MEQVVIFYQGLLESVIEIAFFLFFLNYGHNYLKPRDMNVIFYYLKTNYDFYTSQKNKNTTIMGIKGLILYFAVYVLVEVF